MKKKPIVKIIQESLWLLAGIMAASFGLKGMLLPNSFIDGGVTGIALLVAETTIFDLSYVVLFVSLPFLVLGYKQMSRMFVIKTSISIVVLSLVLAFVEFPVITNDLLLVAIFGGFFLGAGMGLAIRGGGVIDGLEILALYLTRRINISIGDIIMLSNVLIFGAAAWLLGLEEAMYSMIAYFVASKTVDFFIKGIEEYLGLTIISEDNERIKERIIKEMNTGVTVFTSKGGYGNRGDTKAHNEVLYTVITRLEFLKVQQIVKEVDKTAFIVIEGVRDVSGGMIKRRTLPD